MFYYLCCSHDHRLFLNRLLAAEREQDDIVEYSVGYRGWKLPSMSFAIALDHGPEARFRAYRPLELVLYDDTYPVEADLLMKVVSRLEKDYEVEKVEKPCGEVTTYEVKRRKRDL